MAFENSFEEPCRSGGAPCDGEVEVGLPSGEISECRHLLTGFRFWLSSVSAAS